MATAGISCGTVRGRGAAWPWAPRFAYASMRGAKSVPALAKRYSTPRAARSSRYASAVLSIAIRLAMRCSLLPRDCPTRGDYIGCSYTEQCGSSAQVEHVLSYRHGGTRGQHDEKITLISGRSHGIVFAATFGARRTSLEPEGGQRCAPIPM